MSDSWQMYDRACPNKNQEKDGVVASNIWALIIEFHRLYITGPRRMCFFSPFIPQLCKHHYHFSHTVLMYPSNQREVRF